MLRKIRLTAAIVCFVLITLLFLDFTGTLHGWFGWLAKIQFLPAVLALNVGVVLFLVLLTLFRTYLLLGDLSAGCFPGCYRAGRQEREEATLFLFAGTILVALRNTGRFYPGLGGGDRFPGRFARSLQRVWAYR